MKESPRMLIIQTDGIYMVDAHVQYQSTNSSLSGKLGINCVDEWVKCSG